FALNRTHRMTHEIFGQAPGSRVSWASEIMYFSGQHGAPTIDAIGHIGRDLKLFGGVDAVAATSTPGGIGANLGIETFPADLMINRAVLLDVARHVASGRPDPLPPGFEITARHLDETMKAQGVDVQRGDSLLIRTGWGPYFGTDNAKYLGEHSPGPGQDAARWIIARGAGRPVPSRRADADAARRGSSRISASTSRLSSLKRGEVVRSSARGRGSSTVMRFLMRPGRAVITDTLSARSSASSTSWVTKSTVW